MHNANVSDGSGGIGKMVNFINNVVYARQLRLSIIVVLASAWNIRRLYYDIAPQLTSERTASHTIYAPSLWQFLFLLLLLLLLRMLLLIRYFFIHQCVKCVCM